jgi:RNA polymerase sigma factor FliA
VEPAPFCLSGCLLLVNFGKRKICSVTEHEPNLWRGYDPGDNTGGKELILFYLPLVDLLAKRISRSTGANWEDLRQDGVMGLMKAIDRFDPSRNVPFRAFARTYIRGAIFDSSAITGDMARRQEEIYRKSRQVEAELTQTLQRNPTIEEVAEKAELTVEQIQNAIDARGVAFAETMVETEDEPPSRTIDVPSPERAIFLLQAISYLTPREQEIIQLYYWQDQPHEEIAQTLGLTAGNVKKIRQRAINKLRKRLDVSKREFDENK